MAMVEKVNAARVRQVLGFLFPGDMFGLAHGARYTHGVTGLIDGHGLAFARGAFDDLCERSPAMQRAVFQEASNELAAAQDHLVLLGRKSASERLASFLLSMLEQSPLGDGQRHVWLPMRRSDIANYLGLTLETLSRLFADFMAHGVISRQSVRHIAIRDRAALERVAGSA
jgi:CRP/FNR family transcriptional regulator